MKIVTSIAILLLMVGNVDAQDLKTKQDSIDYAIGVITAQHILSEGVCEEKRVMTRGLNDQLANKSLLSIDQANILYKEGFNTKNEKDMEKNKIAGEEFLKENAKKEGIVTLPSGLQYEVLVEGTGQKPNPTDKVNTHYHGTLIDGTVFDSSVNRGEPISFGLNQVIEAWQEALPLMNVGSKYRIYSPYNLAYGERGAGAAIKPYSALIFEIELLGIE